MYTAPLHKIFVWTQIRKIKRKLIFSQSESRIKDLRLICLICVQMQLLCNGAMVPHLPLNVNMISEPYGMSHRQIHPHNISQDCAEMTPSNLKWLPANFLSFVLLNNASIGGVIMAEWLRPLILLQEALIRISLAVADKYFERLILCCLVPRKGLQALGC